MSIDSKNHDFARREAASKIQWGAEVEEVASLLQSKYNVTGAEADAMIAEALAARRSLVRKKAGIRLGFAVVGLAISLTYFGIQFAARFAHIGLGTILMASLGLVSLAAAGKSVSQMLSGDAPGPIQ